MSEKIRLTQTVLKGGCAAKVAASELREILRGVQFPPAAAELMIDGRDFDDAAVWRVSDQLALVQTIDFFTPILDTPFDFGRVAAANALSDVYAMGGRPTTALAVLAFPVATLPREVTTEVLNGACHVLAQARCALAGGHSIDDDTLKFGLSVSGFVHPDRVWSNAGARPGDALILTKALGTGTLTAALKRDAATEDDIREAIDSMTSLNDAITPIESAGLAAHVHAATDITGFGLSGHSTQMARASGVQFEIDIERVARLPRAEEFLAREFLTKAHRTNRTYTESYLETSNLSATEALLIHDPQTSGGLLLAVAGDQAARIEDVLRTKFPATRLIGRVTDTARGRVRISR